MGEVTKEIEKYLSTPVYGELSENAYKIRRNLLVISCISIFAILGDININRDTVTLSGVAFNNLTDLKIDIGLLAFNFYFLVHFIWISIHSCVEWRLRLSGLSDSETLYNWWLRQISSVEKLIIPSEDVIAHTKKAVELNTNEITKVKELNQSTINLMFYLKAMKGLTIDDKSLEKSLLKFDKWYRLLANSQNFRWIFMEMGFPTLLGLISTFLLIVEIYKAVCT